MTFPKWSTTVTPFSKATALIVFITFPILGFLLGLYFQSIIDYSEIHSESHISPTPKISLKITYVDPEKEFVLDGYYYASDLGIKFKLSPELQKQTLIARIKKENFDGPVVWLDFSTKYLSDITSNCAVENGALGSLWRGEGKYKELPSNMLIKQFKTFFIAYNNGGYNCGFESSAAIQDKLGKAITDFQDAINMATEITIK